MSETFRCQLPGGHAFHARAGRRLSRAEWARLRPALELALVDGPAADDAGLPPGRGGAGAEDGGNAMTADDLRAADPT